MSTANETDGSVPIGWILAFVLLALGTTAAALFYVTGGEFGLVLPPLALALH